MGDVKLWSLAFCQTQALHLKVQEFPYVAWALSQHQNEPVGQRALGLLAPRNLAAWLAKPSDLAGLDRGGTLANYQAQKAAQKVLGKLGHGEFFTLKC